MSSFPEHEKNVERIKAMGLPIEDMSDDPYEGWDYDVLVDWVSQLIDIIEEQNQPDIPAV